MCCKIVSALTERLAGSSKVVLRKPPTLDLAVDAAQRSSMSTGSHEPRTEKLRARGVHDRG